MFPILLAAFALGPGGRVDGGRGLWRRRFVGPAGRAPPPSPTTLWSFLGIPQGINQIRDATSNRLGNNPDAERQLPLKRIADPENMQSKNPAISAAAKIKADQDQAQQQIKAIKFLAETGCCCPANKDIVKDALLASLDDCTEAVRYEAAKALCAVAGACAACSTCPGQVSCPKCTCCTAEVMNKLNEVANGTTAEGCPIEPSPRVRCAAADALEQCRRSRQPTTQMAEAEQPQKPKPEQVPLERRAPVGPKPETRQGPPQIPAPPTAPGQPTSPTKPRVSVPATSTVSYALPRELADSFPLLLLRRQSRCDDQSPPCWAATRNDSWRASSSCKDLPSEFHSTQFTIAAGDAVKARLQSAANNSPPFRFGETGEAVKNLQRALEQLHDDRIVILSGVDGNYLAETRAAVITFQQINGLSPDGEAGRATLVELDAQLSELERVKSVSADQK